MRQSVRRGALAVFLTLLAGLLAFAYVPAYSVSEDQCVACHQAVGVRAMHNYAYAEAALETSVRLLDAAPQAISPAGPPKPRVIAGETAGVIGGLVAAALGGMAGGVALFYFRGSS